MKLACASCRRVVDVASGQSPPPWCVGCGADFEAAAVGAEAEPTSQSAEQLAVNVLNLQVDAVQLRRCPTCKARVAPNAGDVLPPWCSKCGADINAEPVPESAPPQSGTADSGGRGSCRAERSGALNGSAGASPSQVAEVNSGPTLSDTSGFNPESYVAAAPVADDNMGRDDRFAIHNLLVGAGLGIWGFVMASGMGPSPDQEVLDSYGPLMSAIDLLQVIMILNGVALFVSGVGLRQGQRWGRRLAFTSACVSIFAGGLFVVAWQFLIQASSGGEVVEAVATMTFVRTNLDLLIGLVDGGALLMFLNRARTSRNNSLTSGYAAGWT